MHRICPQCQGTFASQFLCPNCGIQLLDMPDRSAANHGVAGDPGLHMRNVGRQLLAGLLLSQALYYALRQTATGLTLLHISAEPNNLLVLAGLEVVGTLAGGLVAGAGNPRGLAAGAAVGVLNAIILVGTQFALGG